jgi:two-component system, NtrC family, response regulator AtoC
MDRILIIDPDETIRREFDLAAAKLPGFYVELTRVETVEQALEHLGQADLNAVVCDHRIDGGPGRDIVLRIADRLPEGVVVLTGTGARDLLAQKAAQRGAFDCLTRPLQATDVILTLNRIRDRASMLRRQAALDRQIEKIHQERAIVAASDSMIEVLESLERAADFDSPAFLSGEVGTRKPLMAQTIHAQSSRRTGPFVEVRCGQYESHEIERQLFGGGGGRTGGQQASSCGLIELADRGTLFLGQIEKLPMNLQRQIHRLIEEREIWREGDSQPRPINIRVIAASSEDLSVAVAEGRFDQKLHERLKCMEIQLPALRERRRDIPLLIDQFLAHFQNAMGKNVGPISSEALERLCDYPWPGNVRELQNAIERAVILAGSDGITLAHVPQGIVEDYRAQLSNCGENFALKPARQLFEAQLIRRALESADGNRTHAAALLAISHRNLLYKLKAYKIRD